MNERVVVLGNILFICENCHSTGCFSRLHLGEWKSDISISLPHACTLHYLARSGAFLTFWSECQNLTKLSEIPQIRPRTTSCIEGTYELRTCSTFHWGTVCELFADFYYYKYGNFWSKNIYLFIKKRYQKRGQNKNQYWKFTMA